MFRMRPVGGFSEVKQKLEQRLADWQSANLRARVTVPPELKWWYWNEFGTASRGDTERGASGNFYPIDPVNKKLLSFPTEEGQVVALHVDHPGIHPHRFVLNSLPGIMDFARINVRTAFIRSGGDVEAVRIQLMEVVMPEAITEIARFMFFALPGTRMGEYSGLNGQVASDVFEREAKIVNTGT